MRVGYFVSTQNTSSALYNIMSHMASEVGEIVVDDITNYDVAVYESPTKMAGLLKEAHKFCKRVVMFHSTPSKDEARIKGEMEKGKPHLTFVTHDEALYQVRSWGHEAVKVPFSFNTSRFKHLPYPSTYTLGQMGTASKNKRFDEVGSKSLTKVLTASRKAHCGGGYEGREVDFYSKISTYICASEKESGPLPPLEALCCGRPIISTKVGMMTEVIREHGVGLFVEDDLSDLAAKVQEMQFDFETYAKRAREWVLPNTALLYAKYLKEL